MVRMRGRGHLQSWGGVGESLGHWWRSSEGKSHTHTPAHQTNHNYNCSHMHSWTVLDICIIDLQTSNFLKIDALGTCKLWPLKVAKDTHTHTHTHVPSSMDVYHNWTSTQSHTPHCIQKRHWRLSVDERTLTLAHRQDQSFADSAVSWQSVLFCPAREPRDGPVPCVCVCMCGCACVCQCGGTYTLTKTCTINPSHLSHLTEAQLQVWGMLPLVTVEGSVDHQLLFYEGHYSRVSPESSQQYLTHPRLRGVEYRSTRAGGIEAINRQRRYDTRLSSRQGRIRPCSCGCYFLIEGKKDKEVVKNAFQWRHSAGGK